MLMSLLYKLARAGVEVVPRPVAVWAAKRIADICFAADSRGRRAVISNLRHVFSSLGRDTASNEARRELRRLARETFENFAVHILDFLRIPRIETDMRMGMVRLDHFDRFERAYGEGKGLISVTAHIGNWELGAAAVARKGYPLHAVALQMKDPRVDSFFASLRISGGLHPIPLGHAAWNCFKALKKHEVVAFVADRDINGNGYLTDFFGKPVRIPRGPAEIAVKSGAPIVPAFLVQEKGGYFRLVFEEPITVDGQLPMEEKVDRINRAIIGYIERYIARYPSQWFAFYEVWG